MHSICHFYLEMSYNFICFKNKYFFQVWAQNEINLENESKGELPFFSGNERELELLTWVGRGNNDERKISREHWGKQILVWFGN